MSKKKKVRVEMRKNRAKPPRGNDLTRGFEDGVEQADTAISGERVRAKGDMSRRRTVIVDSATDLPITGDGADFAGRVLRVHGLVSFVELEDGRVVRCALRRILKTLATEGRSLVTTGDRVRVRPARPEAPFEGTSSEPDAFIEHVEPRRGILARTSRRQKHVLVANVDQLLIVMSLREPDLKPHLIDRYIAAAYRGDLAPIVCLNKADRTDPTEWQPMVGAYSQLGIPTLLTSATTGVGIERLRGLLKDRSTVFSGQSGVGKSSLLNAVQPGLALRVKSVSEGTQKGRHTTTNSELIRLEAGGYVVDTPGVRQLQLWDTRKEEVEGYFPDFRPFVPGCNFPDCTHQHETGCEVRRAVARHWISERRYQSYMGLFHGLEEDPE